MDASFSSMYEILMFAHKREEEAIQFYTMLQVLPQFASHQKFLRKLQQQEEEHLACMRSCLQDESLLDVRVQSRPGQCVNPVDFLMQHNLHDDLTLARVLRMALQRERDSWQLYKTLAEESISVDIQQIFRKLAREEKSHCAAVESIFHELYKNSDILMEE